MQRTDFNSDNAKIDAALAGLAALVAGVPKIAAGTYVGDGEESRFIDVGFTPKAVFVCDNVGATTRLVSDTVSYGGLAVPGGPIYPYDTAHLALQVVTGGFKVFNNSVRSPTNSNYYYTSATNANGCMMRYIAIG